MLVQSNTAALGSNCKIGTSAAEAACVPHF